VLESLSQLFYMLHHPQVVINEKVGWKMTKGELTKILEMILSSGRCCQRRHRKPDTLVRSVGRVLCEAESYFYADVGWYGARACVGSSEIRPALAFLRVPRAGKGPATAMANLERSYDITLEAFGDALAAKDETALRIAEQYSYGIYDALIAAAALEAGCVTLYSEDFQDGQIIDGQLTIRNPFKGLGQQLG